MTRSYLVHMPVAEGRHLAGTSPAWPATAGTRLAGALQEWLAGLSRCRAAVVPVRKVVTDLTRILEAAPLPARPVRGPFGPAPAGPALQGCVEYLGAGVVRLDGDALTSLAGLGDGEDFKVTFTDAGPVLAVGPDRYAAREEEPGTKEPGQHRGGASQTAALPHHPSRGPGGPPLLPLAAPGAHRQRQAQSGLLRITPCHREPLRTSPSRSASR